MSQPQPNPMILWVAFCGTHLMLVVASLIAEVPAAPAAPIPYALALFAVTVAGFSTQATTLARIVPGPAGILVRYALAEAAALSGFACFFMTGEHTLQLACAGVGFVAHALAFPGKPGV